MTVLLKQNDVRALTAAELDAVNGGLKGTVGQCDRSGDHVEGPPGENGKAELAIVLLAILTIL